MSDFIKLYISERTNLMEKLFNQENGIEVVKDPSQAEFILTQSNVKYPEYISKTIYMASEPPRSRHRKWCYENYDNFLLVIAHDADPNNPKQMSFQKYDEVQFYPVRANPYPYVTRLDTTIGSRGVFFAGMVDKDQHRRDRNLPRGATSISHLRKIMGEYFLQHHPGSKIIGIGWNGQTIKNPKWRLEKLNDMADKNVDFILALENTILTNYLSEKIWDGIAADKVTMYLGDPRIEHHIPLNCFIDLRPYYNKQNGDIDMNTLSNRLKTMTQEEYDSILKNAREFRLGAKNKYFDYCIELTYALIDFMKKNRRITL